MYNKSTNGTNLKQGIEMLSTKCFPLHDGNINMEVC